MKIEVVEEYNFEDVLPLVREYQIFYDAKPDDARNREFFGQFSRTHEKGVQFIAYDGGEAIGFATVYFIMKSTRACVIASLNDLYVRENYRGLRKGGAALALMDAAFNYARDNGYPMLQGETTVDNFAAQKFYEHYGTKKVRYAATRSSWYIYLVDFTIPLADGEFNVV